MFNKNRGNRSRRETQHSSVLAAEDVVEIRRLRGEGYTLRQLAIKYGCTFANIRKITTRQSWNHI